MKEKLEGLTPLEMDNIEKNRLSLEDAQELANMIITKFEGFDLSKLEPADYEEAEKEIEEIRKWAEGNETTIDKLVLIIKDSAVLCTISTVSMLGLNELVVKLGSPDLINSFSIAAGYIGAAVLSGDPIARKEVLSKKGLRDLSIKTEDRLEAEKKFKID